MSFAGRIARGTATREQSTSFEVAPGEGGWMQGVLAGWNGESDRGHFDERGALRLASVWAAIRVLTDDVASLPMPVYQRTQGGGRSRAYWEPAYRLLAERPNPEQTPTDFKARIMLDLLSHGNAFVGKQFSPSGKIVESLWSIPAYQMEVVRKGNDKLFRHSTPDGPVYYDSSVIIHIMGLSVDGLVGLSPIQMHRATVGLGLSLEQYAAKLFENRAVPAGVISTKKRLDLESAKQLRDKWEATYRGAANAHRVAVLDEEASFKPISLPLADSQYVELSKLNIADVARIFRVPASMIGGATGDSLTYSTVEGDSLHYLKHSLRPHLTRVEEAFAADRHLFPNGTLYPEFLVDALLRADTKTRYDAYSLATAGQPWATPQEIRQLENLPYDARFDANPAVAPANGATGSTNAA